MKTDSCYPTIDPVLCDVCGQCVDVCPSEAIHMAKGKTYIDQALCVLCLACVDMCPQNAIGVPGTAPEVVSPMPALGLPRQDESSLSASGVLALREHDGPFEPAVKPGVAEVPQVSPASESRAGIVVTLAGVALSYLGKNIIPEVLSSWLDSRETRSRPGGGESSCGGQRGRGRGGGRRRARNRGSQGRRQGRGI